LKKNRFGVYLGCGNDYLPLAIIGYILLLIEKIMCGLITRVIANCFFVEESVCRALSKEY